MAYISNPSARKAALDHAINKRERAYSNAVHSAQFLPGSEVAKLYAAAERAFENQLAAAGFFK